MKIQSKDIMAILPMAAVIFLSACHSGKDKTTESEGTPEVTVATPQTDSIVLRQSYPGFLISDRDAVVVARVSGTVTAKHYTDGEIVQEGQPLFSIESTTYQAQLDEAKSKLESATANNEYCSKHYEALTKALQSDAVSKMDVEQAESALRQSEADIRSARAAVTTASTMLSYCTIRAPFRGHVAAPSVVVGDYVNGEASPVKVTTVYDDRVLLVSFSVEDSRYLQIMDTRGAQTVDYKHVPVIFGDTIAGKYTGEMDYVAPTVDKNTGTIGLRIVLDNDKDELRNGMYCTVNLPYAVEPHAMLIKDAAISTDQLGKYVYVVNDSNKVVYTPVQVGDLYQDSLRVITSGLKDTDRYVTEALLKVRDGMTVKPISH